MKIYDVVNEGPKEWIARKFADRAAKQAAEKAAEAALKAERELVAKELEHFAPYMEKWAEKYADEIIAASSIGKKPPAFRSEGAPLGSTLVKDWLDKEAPSLSAKPLAVQTAIRKQVLEKAEQIEATKMGRNVPKGGEEAPTPPVKDPKKSKEPKEKDPKKEKEKSRAQKEKDKEKLKKYIEKYGPDWGKNKAIQKIGNAANILRILGMMDVIVTFLQKAAVIDHAMADTENPLPPDEANRLHQLIQADCYAELLTLGLGPKFLSKLGWTGSILTGAAVGYVIATYSPDRDKYKDAIQGGMIGALNPIAKMIIDYLFKGYGDEAYQLFMYLAMKSSAPVVAEVMASKEGTQFVAGFTWNLFDVPDKSENPLLNIAANPFKVLGGILNTIRGMTPDAATDIRRATYEIYWDYFGKELAAAGLGKNIPPPGSGPIAPEHKLNPAAVVKPPAGSDINPNSTPSNTVTTPTVVPDKQSGQPPQGGESEDDAAKAAWEKLTGNK
jgi:hypothetical protein